MLIASAGEATKPEFQGRKIMLEKEIEIINRIIVEAIVHGSDGGGSYNMNEENLISSIVSWLEFNGIANDYEVKEVEKVQTCWGFYGCIPQIVKKFKERKDG